MRKRRGSPCQVGAGKANASEPLLTRRDEETASKPGYPNNPGTKPGGRPPTGQVVPGVKVARARSAASARNVGRQASTQPRSRAKPRAVVRGSALQTSNCGSYGPPPLTGAACAMPWHAVSRSCSGQIDFGFIL